MSIIMATYNSSYLLKFAIQSVIDGDYPHWEIIVVGDCCTDDTEACVLSFNDDRIRFINLEENSGQQAKPNNVGLSLAHGEYIAFLNQDDMYFKTHLSDCISYMKDPDVDIVCVPGVQILPTSEEDLLKDQFDSQVIGAHPNGKYFPFVFSVASSWFMRNHLVEKVGLWKTESSLFVTPSQEWLFRAHRAGARFHFPDKVGILIIFSSARPNFYQKCSSFEHEYFYQKMKEPVAVARLFEKAAIYESRRMHQELSKPLKLLLRIGAYPVYRVLEAWSIHPASLHMLVKWGWKGKFISHLRKKAGVGLPKKTH